MLAAFRALIARGAKAKEALTVRRAAARLKTPKSTLYDRVRAHGVWNRHPGFLSPETLKQLDQLILDDVPEAEICDRLGVGKGSVWRRKRWLREQAAGVASCAPWRCPACGGKLVVVRCPLDGTKRPA